jgi:hypothetical protein
MDITLGIKNTNGEIISSKTGADNLSFVYTQEYHPGDRIFLETDAAGSYLVVMLEDSMAAAFVYMDGTLHEMPVPFGEKRAGHSPKSFTGNKHLLFARKATQQEIDAYKNVAFNPYDCHENAVLFPHAKANVETRGETQFAARNAIDGVYANELHGSWPWHSWGINRDPAAQIRIDFGRKVTVDKAALTTRADFPHDSWWVQGTLEFSDGSSESFPLTNAVQPQPVSFKKRTVEWVILKDLIKADNESPFPALTQIEIWGTEA